MSMEAKSWQEWHPSREASQSQQMAQLSQFRTLFMSSRVNDESMAGGACQCCPHSPLPAGAEAVSSGGLGGGEAVHG
eukprot:scaffold678367_cov57-Prasinocladus_malaysianus.AAC.1